MGEGPSTSALEFLGALAGGLVHEIKNPLSTLAINLTLLQEDLEAALPSDRTILRRVEILRQEVRRLEAALSDFSRFAGMRKLDRKRLDLKDLVEGILEFCGPGFRRDGIDVRQSVDPLFVEGDAPLLKQALLNVLLNSQQAMERGGTLSVTGRAEGGRAVLEIEDSGCGIAPKHLPRVFDVYYSASKKGSGLGLPTARRVAEQHGGSLDLVSEAGRGTKVTIQLPLAGE